MSTGAFIVQFNVLDIVTGPNADRPLEATNHARRSFDKEREVGVRAGGFGAGLLHQRVADDDGASEFAGQGLEPARRVHGGADHGEFEPVEADIAQYDLPVMQSDADLDRWLTAVLSFPVQRGNRGDHAPRASQGV